MSLGYLEMERRVSAAEADVASLMRPGAVFTMMQEIAGLHSEQLGCGRIELLEKYNIVWMLSRVALEMERYPRLFETIRLRTWPGEAGKAAYPRYFEFYGEDGARIGAAASAWVLADISTRKIVPPRTARFAVPGAAELHPPLAEAGRFRADTEGGARFDRTPLYADIDENGHVNNARYVDWIADLFPLERHKAGRIASLSIHYAAEILPGSLVEMSLKENGSEFAVAGGVDGRMAFQAIGKWTAAV